MSLLKLIFRIKYSWTIYAMVHLSHSLTDIHTLYVCRSYMGAFEID